MNLQEVNEKNNSKLALSKTYTLMSDFNEQVMLNPGVQVIDDKMKDKRVKLIQSVSREMIKYHDAFKPHVKDFGDSIVLIGSDRAVDYMINEAISFSKCLMQLNEAKKTTQNFGQIQEFSAYYKNLNLTTKKIKDALISDLKMYASDYSFEFNPKMVSDTFKEAGL